MEYVVIIVSPSTPNKAQEQQQTDDGTDDTIIARPNNKGYTID